MTFRARTSLCNLLTTLPFLAIVLAMLQGCTSGSSGGGTTPPNNSTPGITTLNQMSGAVGTPVTITGTNFGATQGASTVTFNGTAAYPDKLECNEHHRAGAEWSDDGECSGDGRRSGEQWSELHGDRTGTEYHEPESDVRSGGNTGDDHGDELWSDAGREHGDVQRNGGDTDELECDEHHRAGAEWSDDGECGGDGRRSGEQWSEFHGDRTGTEYHEPESDVGSGGNPGDDHGDELWSDARDERGHLQRNSSDSDDLECDEHHLAGADRSDDGECGGDGRRGGK